MKVITSLNIAIMEEITKDLSRKWSINGMARQIHKYYRPVHAAVQSLLKQGFLRKNQNSLIEPAYEDTILLELAEKQRLAEHGNKEIIIINERLSRLKTIFFSAVLFGSSVDKKGKDIDILVIMPDSGEMGSFQRQAEVELGSFYSKVDLSIISEESCYEMLNRPNQLNVMNEIMKNHLVLVGMESFYKIIRRWKHG